MAPRANWKGYLKLSLVSCAVNLYPASSSSSRVSFSTINRKTGNKVKRQFIDAESGEVVEADDQAKGYPISKSEFLLMDDGELDAIQIESTHTIDIEKFVPRGEVDPRYLETPYYIAPNERVGEEAFAVIREAMQDEKVVGLGRAVIARRERIVMLEPLGKGLLGTVLRFGYEVRAEDAYFEEIPDLKLPAEMKEMAHVIIQRKAGHFLPDEFNDRYEDALRKSIAAEGGAAPASAQSKATGIAVPASKPKVASKPKGGAKPAVAVASASKARKAK